MVQHLFLYFDPHKDYDVWESLGVIPPLFLHHMFHTAPGPIIPLTAILSSPLQITSAYTWGGHGITWHVVHPSALTALQCRCVSSNT